jgi:hypothetical protein
MPLSEVRSGMRCTALTVVRGTEISSFDAEVVDIVAGQAGAYGPRILVRVSGPAVDATGIGPGFSGSPIYCDDGSGTRRNAGAISESVGDYGNKLALVTPIEEILGETPDPPRGARRDPALRASARPLQAVTVAGLHPLLARRLAARVRRPLITAPAGPLTSFPPQELRPGSAVGVGLSSGDLALGAIGTVAYTDGPTAWVFGHQLEGVGARSLLLQDAYVFTVVNNPLGVEGATTYKLASPVHDLGAATSDGTAAVAGRSGALPDRFTLHVVAHDLDRGRVGGAELLVADESALGNPAGGSPLAVVAPLAVMQAGTAVLNALPARLSGSMCVRFELQGREEPIRFCNDYVVPGVAGPGTNGFSPLVADIGTAVSLLDLYSFGPLHVTRVEANVKLRRGVRQAFMLRARAPRRVRAGRRIPIRLTVRQVNGPRRTIRLRLRVPRSLPAGVIELELAGRAADALGEDIVIDLEELFSGEEDEEGDDVGDPGPRSVDELAAEIEGIERFNGLRATFRRSGRRSVLDEDPEAYRHPTLRLSGRTTVRFRIVE